MENLNAYANRLENALTTKTPFHTYNRDILHAAEIVVAGFRHAQHKIWLLSERLDLSLYGNERLLTAVREFLGRPGSELRILVETEIDAKHPIRQLAENEFPESMKIGLVPDDVKKNYAFNFMIVDDIGYRFEYDREVYEAIASFYEEERIKMVQNLQRMFRVIEKQSENLESKHAMT